MAALALGAAGWRVLVVERETEIFALPRAIHFDGEVMRLFQRLGVAEALAPHLGTADAYEFLDRTGRVFLRVDRSRERQPEGWPPLFLFRQPDLEAALRARIATLPTVAVRLGTAVETVTPEVDGVALALRTGEGRQTVRARYVLGCDGARSRTREALGIPMRPPRPLRRGIRTEGAWLVVDVRLRDGADGGALPRALQQRCDPAAPTTYLPGPGRTRRWEFLLREDEDEAEAIASVCQRLAAHVDPGTVEVERAAVYTFRALAAARWRSGRVLLLGDAAHLMPPFTGQGLGSGVRDAADAAWKLDLVLRGVARPALLDAVERERAPQVAAITRRALLAGRVLMVRSRRLAVARDAFFRTVGRLGVPLHSLDVPLPPLRAGVAGGGGGRLPQPRVRLDGALVRLDDALGPGFALVGWRCDPRTRTDPEAWASVSARAVRVVPPGEAAAPRLDLAPGLTTITDASGALAAWFRQRGTDAVAVRPDRAVFADLERGDAVAALVAYLRTGRVPRTRRRALAGAFGLGLAAGLRRSA